MIDVYHIVLLCIYIYIHDMDMIIRIYIYIHNSIIYYDIDITSYHSII